MDKNIVYLIVAVISVFAAWLIRGSQKSSQSGNAGGSFLVNVNGKPSESGYYVNDSGIGLQILWTSEKINSLLKGVINDSIYSDTTTFSSNKLKNEFDSINFKLASIIDDKKTGPNTTWSSEKILGMINPSVYFDAIRNTSFKVAGNIVYDALKTSSNNSGLDIATGIFTCPVAGLYRLTFTGLRYYFVNAPIEARVRMILNNEIIATTASTNALLAPDLNPRPSGGETLNMNLLLDLKVGDKVWCRVDSGGIFDISTEHLTHFTGEILKIAQ